MEQVYKLSQQLNMPLIDFLKNYIELKDEKFTLENTEMPFKVLILKQNNDSCIFLHNKKCKIHKFKPFQCQHYPFFEEIFNNKENFKKMSLICKGFGKGKRYEEKEIKEKLDQNYLFYRKLYQDSIFIMSLNIDKIVNGLKLKLEQENQEIEESALEEIKKELLFKAIDKYYQDKSV